MRPGDANLGERLDTGLQTFHAQQHRLPGIQQQGRRPVLVEQMVESDRRVRFVQAIRMRDVSPQRADPRCDLFDPLKAAIHFQRLENVDEAFWMVFFFVHFGKNARGGWRYARDVYGSLGGPRRWDWATTSADPEGLRDWLHQNQAAIRGRGVPGGFGNHRKRQTLDARHRTGTGAAFASYVRWVQQGGGHQPLIRQAMRNANCDAGEAFDYLYCSMNAVSSFGRLARFDYLTMLGKLGLAPIEPSSPYLAGSSGPRKGAELLFGRGRSLEELDDWTAELGNHLGLGMQVMEDSLCNWQKSPDHFVEFRG